MIRKFMIVFFMVVSATVASASDQVIWIEDGSWETYHSAMEALDASGAAIRHVYPPHFIAGNVEWVHCENLPHGVSLLTKDRDARANQIVPASAGLFLEAWRRLQEGHPTSVVVNEMPLVGDVIFMDDDPLSAGFDRDSYNQMKAGEKSQPYGAEATDTSLYMIGDVSVSVILPESNGGSEDWTTQEMSDVTAEILTGLNWWSVNNPDAHLTFHYNWEYQVPIDSEPIVGNWYDGWNVEVLYSLGYSNSYPAIVYDYINDQRIEKNTDWGFIIFVADSSNDVDGKFLDGSSALAIMGPDGGGPYCIMTYDNGGYGIGNMDSVASHEMGHIFGAIDQYSPCSCSDDVGYLNYENQNCMNDCVINEESIMKGSLGGFNLNAIDYYARGQIGWVDSDTDGILDIVDTNPILSLESGFSQTDLTFELTGSTIVNPLPAVNPYYNTVTINTITSVEFRIDSDPWQEASPADGTFDDPEESFIISVTVDPGSMYNLECRAVNSVGNFSASSFMALDALSSVPDATSLALTAHPNPFNPQTEIHFTLSKHTRVQFAIYDISGQLVQHLANGLFDEGPQVLPWDGTDDRGRNLPSGVYQARLRAGDVTQVIKLALVR